MNLISREELKEKLDRGDDFKLVMTLGEWGYRAKHIPGSLNIYTAEQGREMLDIKRYRSGGRLINPSGTRKDRPGYLELLRMARNREIDVIRGLEGRPPVPLAVRGHAPLRDA